MNKRIVNCRFSCCGLHFDAAVDCDFDLHCYEQNEMVENAVPVELYCFDHPEWDIRMMFFSERNDKQNAVRGFTYHTCVNIDDIRREARKWVKEMINSNNF